MDPTNPPAILPLAGYNVELGHPDIDGFPHDFVLEDQDRHSYYYKSHFQSARMNLLLLFSHILYSTCKLYWRNSIRSLCSLYAVA